MSAFQSRMSLRDRAPILERRLEFAVVDVEHLRGDAENPRRFQRLRGAPAGQWPAGLAPVSDVAVGDGDEFHLMSERRPLRGRPREAQLVVVGMRPERDDSQGRTLCCCGQNVSCEREQHSHRG